jgi:hypothetical protein
MNLTKPRFVFETDLQQDIEFERITSYYVSGNSRLRIFSALLNSFPDEKGISVSIQMDYRPLSRSLYGNWDYNTYMDNDIFSEDESKERTEHGFLNPTTINFEDRETATMTMLLLLGTQKEVELVKEYIEENDN